MKLKEPFLCLGAIIILTTDSSLQVFNANMYQINPNLILLSFELNLYLHCIRMV